MESAMDIDSTITEIRSRIREINIVSFSGGKDSTTVLQLVLAALDGQSGKSLYIVTSDTLMEIPYFQEYVDRAKEKLQAHIQANRLNAHVVTVHPEIRDSFWVSVLGKGYPAAHMGFRWCTGKLKIDPITKFTKQLTAGREFTVFVGVRRAESALRAKIYQVQDYKVNHFAPILHWTSHDVWDFLLTQPCPWDPVNGHSELVNVYKYSSDECVYGEKQGVCVGNARYGCWACPLQADQQLDMIGYHTRDGRYKHLKRFKNFLVSMANRSATRSRIRRRGEAGTGPFLVEMRQLLYRELKAVETKTGWQLITAEEEACIRDHWQMDAAIHNVPDQTQPLLWGAI